MASVSSLKKYTTHLAIAGVSLAVLSSFGHYLWPQVVHPLWFIMLLFFLGIQWLVFAFVLKFGQHKPRTIVKQFQAAKFAKLCLFLIVMAVYVFTVKTKAMAFTFLITFIVYYSVFTALEMFSFQRWMGGLPSAHSPSGARD